MSRTDGQRRGGESEEGGHSCGGRRWRGSVTTNRTFGYFSRMVIWGKRSLLFVCMYDTGTYIPRLGLAHAIPVYK